MTSFFDTALAVSGAVHNTLYGETFRIEPKAKKPGDPDARAIADPKRAAQSFTGIWTDPHVSQRPTNKTGHSAGESAMFGDDKPRVDFEVAALPYAVAIGDVVTRLKTNERFTVSDPGDDGFSRATIALTSRSR